MRCRFTLAAVLTCVLLCTSCLGVMCQVSCSLGSMTNGCAQAVSPASQASAAECTMHSQGAADKQGAAAKHAAVPTQAAPPLSAMTHCLLSACAEPLRAASLEDRPTVKSFDHLAVVSLSIFAASPRPLARLSALDTSPPPLLLPHDRKTALRL